MLSTKEINGISTKSERKSAIFAHTPIVLHHMLRTKEKIWRCQKVQENKCEEKELICINVDKVYDWIVRENTFDIFPAGPISFPGVTADTVLTGATVTCEVLPAAANPIEILNRENRQLCIDGVDVCLQQLTIRKNFTLTIVVTLPSGTIFRSGGIPASRNELVTLCAPEGTDVEITFTELDCFVSSTGTLIADAGTITFSALVISVATCQSIQSTYPVTIEMEADFCEPREDFITACSAPIHPPQCPDVFPDNNHHCH